MCTVVKRRGQTSTLQPINSSIIQRSSIGPASYVVNAGDLNALTHGNKLCKFDDPVNPASNVHSRPTEVDNIETWARTNNLTLIRAKSKEIVFINKKRNCQVVPQPPLPGIERVMSLKILGRHRDQRSALDHIQGIITNCAQSFYAVRILQAHDMCDLALQTIYESVIIAKLLYASSARWGFTNASDRHQVDGFLRRSIRCGYCPPDLPPFEDQFKAADRKLFDRIKSDVHHLLYSLLPPPTAASQVYNMRTRPHNRRLPPRSGHLTDSNFITRVLYTDIY